MKHGGGRRCEIAECPRSAAGRTTKCVKHGGGTRCTIEGCNRLAKSGGKWRGRFAVLTKQKASEPIHCAHVNC